MNTNKILDLIKDGLVDSIANLKKEQIQLDSHLKKRFRNRFSFIYVFFNISRR